MNTNGSFSTEKVDYPSHDNKKNDSELNFHLSKWQRENHWYTLLATLLLEGRLPHPAWKAAKYLSQF